MSSTEPSSSAKKAFAALIVVAVLGTLSFGVKQYQRRQSQAATDDLPTQLSMQKTTQPQGSNHTPTTKYKDGTYTASSDYWVPPGSENIKVTVTIKNGIVTDSSVQNSQSNQVSAAFQQGFATEYKSQVVGKKIDKLQLAFVAGASDTTRGFDDAILQIQNQAHA